MLENLKEFNEEKSKKLAKYAYIAARKYDPTFTLTAYQLWILQGYIKERLEEELYNIEHFTSVINEKIQRLGMKPLSVFYKTQFAKLYDQTIVDGLYREYKKREERIKRERREEY